MVSTGGGNGGDGISRVTGEVAKVIAQVPPVIESLTGLRIDDLMDRLRAQPSSPATETEPAATAERPREGGKS